jgi:hypothetical protein
LSTFRIPVFCLRNHFALPIQGNPRRWEAVVFYLRAKRFVEIMVLLLEG